MAMDPREYELIALSHVITRYKITGELPAINGQPFNLNEFKTQLFAGVPNYDSDININIDTVNMENTVVDCDNEHEHHSVGSAAESTPVTEPVIEPVTETTNTQEEISSPKPNDEIEPTSQEQSTGPEKSSISGKLFQFFAKDNKDEPK